MLSVTSDEKILPMTYGELRTPLGKHRLKIDEFISVLLKAGTEAAEKELISSGTIERILDLFFELSRWNHPKIFFEFDDGEIENSDAQYMETKSIADHRSKATLILDSKTSLLRSKKTRKAARSLQEDLFDQLDDEPLELLDQKRTRSTLRAFGNLKRKPE